MKAVIVIPCYNESKRLNFRAFTAFLQKQLSVYILFVNDGSNDNTLELLQHFVENFENASVYNLLHNVGKSEAVRQGMLYAEKNITAKYFGFWDADLATPLIEIEHFILLLDKQEIDAVTGLRLMRLGANVKRKKIRHWIGRLFATVVSILLSIPVYDTQCGAKIYRAKLIHQLFAEKFSTRWLFDVEILARYIKYFGIVSATQRIYECPIFTWEDMSESRLKTKDFLNAPLELLRIKKRYL
ncbi:MAG: glycosyltransferase [Bacteroidales bacterium]